MDKAFLIGLIAKFVATIATYPLIRAKVLLMLSGHNGRGEEGGGGSNGGGGRGGRTLKEQTVALKQSLTWNDPCHVRAAATSASSPSSSNSPQQQNGASEMLQLLRDMYQTGGIIRGLYRGCDIQFFHTVLQSALLMMVWERINVTMQRLLLLERKKEG